MGWTAMIPTGWRPRWNACICRRGGSSGSIRCCGGTGSHPRRPASARCCPMSTASGRGTTSPASKDWPRPCRAPTTWAKRPACCGCWTADPARLSAHVKGASSIGSPAYLYDKDRHAYARLTHASFPCHHNRPRGGFVCLVFAATFRSCPGNGGCPGGCHCPEGLSEADCAALILVPAPDAVVAPDAAPDVVPVAEPEPDPAPETQAETGVETPPAVPEQPAETLPAPDVQPETEAPPKIAQDPAPDPLPQT